MKRVPLLIAGLAVITITVQGQPGKSTTRVERQHKYSHFQKGKMKQSESSILAAIESESVQMQRTAIQTLRDLEQMAPDYPFSSLVTPLANKLKNEQTDRVVRMLAALALDELHSDAGDAVIREVAEKSEDKGLQSLCEALLVRSNTK